MGGYVVQCGDWTEINEKLGVMAVKRGTQIVI